ncbi:zinc finger MYM-type protein 1-like [Rhopalosiphum padi]|uniref:zinc finger MYM-type protein 1-like n=1 Tax=Rhopalosiphum padi TaxID=40932 RepID=UPI00298EBC61|nr:zinc finger MYM-type protein 1-like [Rhopalosiphum padi]
MISKNKTTDPMDPVIPLPSNRLEKMERIKKGPYQPMNIQFPRKTVDDTTDVGHHEQMSVVVRYFDIHLFMPVERFICLKRLLSVNSNAIFAVLSEIMSNYNLNWDDVVSVCFDGASTMSGCISGVQTKCKEENSRIMYVHCYAHCLNLVLVDACTTRRNIPMIFDFFGVVQLCYSFIEGSAVRHAILEKISKDTNMQLKTLKSLSTTRWACRAEAVAALKHNYLVLIPAIEEIISSTSATDVCAKGRGLLFQIKSFNFILGLEIMQPVLQLINKVSKMLQKENYDLLSAMANVKALRLALLDMRTEVYFKKIFDTSVSICKELDVPIPLINKRKISSHIDSNKTQFVQETKESELRISAFYPMIDVMVHSIDERFSQDTMQAINAVDSLLNMDISQTDLYFLSKMFQCDSEKLEVEVMLLKNNSTIPNKDSLSNKSKIHEWLIWLKSNDHYKYFNQFFNVIQKFVVIPVTSCTCERSFSKLTLVKSKLSSTMKQERLNALMVLTVEQEMAVNVDADAVIDDFKIAVDFNRRMSL